jgi:glycosyltransferase involved in cell wall biosynthesis
MTAVSVLILTLNEEANLAGCLNSCSWSDDVVVFDSNSSDHTIEIAKSGGARVYVRPFDNYAAQRNAALQSVSYRNPWVLMVDADERVPKDLVEEISKTVCEVDDSTAMYLMRRKDYFFGRWLKRSSGYPTWFGRLVRPNRVRVEREINEVYVADGRVGRLAAHLEHHPFNKGITWWFDRHNRYSSMEAVLLAKERSLALDWVGCVSRDPLRRRRSLKQIAYRVPGRPLLMFLYLYFVRLGLLDGRAGLNYCLMRVCYEFMIDLKRREIATRTPGLPV